MARTYIPTLILLVRKICIYNGRWSAIIRPALPVDVRPIYDEFTAACDALNAEIGALNPPT